MPGQGIPAPGIVLLLLALSSVFPVSLGAAQERSQQDWGEMLGYKEVRDLTSFGSLAFPGLGSSSFSDDGSYSLTYEDKSVTRFGVFEIQKDGRLCVEFAEDRDVECNAFLLRNGFVFLLTEGGDSIPVHFRLSID
jgi:hypothetical protein